MTQAIKRKNWEIMASASKKFSIRISAEKIELIVGCDHVQIGDIIEQFHDYYHAIEGYKTIRQTFHSEAKHHSVPISKVTTKKLEVELDETEYLNELPQFASPLNDKAHLLPSI